MESPLLIHFHHHYSTLLPHLLVKIQLWNRSVALCWFNCLLFTGRNHIQLYRWCAFFSSFYNLFPEVLTEVCRLSVLYIGSTFDFLSVVPALVIYKGSWGGEGAAQGDGRWKQGLKCEKGRLRGVWDEIEPSALRQCIIWRFHLLASIRGGCCAIKGVSRVCACMCACLHVWVLRVSRVVRCLIEQDGAPLI